MKLDGAAEPRQGALVPYHDGDCPLGTEENREQNKPCETQHDTDEDEDAVVRKNKYTNTNKNSSNSSCAKASAVVFKQNHPSVCDNKNNHSTKEKSVNGGTKQTDTKESKQPIGTEPRRSDAVPLKSLRWPFVATITKEKTENWSTSSLAESVTTEVGVDANTKTMRAQQSLMAAKSNPYSRMDADAATEVDVGSVCGRAAPSQLAFGLGVKDLLTFIVCLVSVVAFQALSVRCDDGDNFFAVNSFSIGPETTTPDFDYASRGKKKFGDKCDNTLECGFPGSICDPKKKSCQCTEDLPVTNHIDKCGKEAAVNESCFFHEQCEVKYFQTECRDGRCICRFEMSPIWGKDGSVECKGRQDKRGPETYIDPAMIGVLVGMALMFIIICVVLRLFSQARWRENRTIFNTPNPRLMNVSLLRDSKLLHGQERRGSRMSVRAPSRQPSMASLRPHSPNPSLGRMIRSKSNTRSSDSRVSDVSTCSRLLEHPDTHRQFLPYVPTTTSSTSAITTTNAHSAAVAAAASVTTTTYVSSPGAAPVCGSGSHGSASNASATSLRSTRSNSVAPGKVSNAHHERKGSSHLQHHQHHQAGQHQQQHQEQPLITNITSNPVAESVTVEIIEPAK